VWVVSGSAKLNSVNSFTTYYFIFFFSLFASQRPLGDDVRSDGLLWSAETELRRKNQSIGYKPIDWSFHLNTVAKNTEEDE
jgi:hypothetical protein